MPASKKMVLLKEDDKGIAAVGPKDGLKELSLPGSGLNDGFAPDSDILVQFKPGPNTSSLAPERMENNFSRLFGGRINRVTNHSLGQHIREGVFKRRPFRAHQLIIQLVDIPAGLFPRKGMEKGLSPPAEKY